MENQLATLTQEIFLVLYRNAPGAKTEYLFNQALTTAKIYLSEQEKHID